MNVTRTQKFSTLALQLAASMLVLTSGGCQALVFLLAGDSGITGRVWRGGCGIVGPLEPPPDCGFDPMQGSFTVYDEEDRTVVTRVTSEPDGTFRVSLPPGTYRIREANDNPIIVTPGEFTEVAVVFEAE